MWRTDNNCRAVIGSNGGKLVDTCGNITHEIITQNQIIAWIARQIHFRRNNHHSPILSRITASTASVAKWSLSCVRIFELSVVLATFIRSSLNF